jgi:uncharacterized protein (TIGR00251 family)
MASDHVTLYVKVQPGAKKTEILGLATIAHPATQQPISALKLKLAAPPVDGKANLALCAFIAELYGVPLRQVTLLSGESSRIKRLQIDAPQLQPDF